MCKSSSFQLLRGEEVLDILAFFPRRAPKHRVGKDGWFDSCPQATHWQLPQGGWAEEGHDERPACWQSALLQHIRGKNTGKKSATRTEAKTAAVIAPSRGLSRKVESRSWGEPDKRWTEAWGCHQADAVKSLRKWGMTSEASYLRLEQRKKFFGQWSTIFLPDKSKEQHKKRGISCLFLHCLSPDWSCV